VFLLAIPLFKNSQTKGATMLALLLANWKQIAIGVAIVFWSAFCYHEGASSVRNEWNRQIMEATIKAREIEQNNQLIGNKIAGDYENKKSSIYDFYSGLLNRLPATSGDMSSKPTATSKPNAATCKDRVSERNKRLALDLAYQAELNTQKLIALQNWVLKVNE
jgi:hypothetical protein